MASTSTNKQPLLVDRVFHEVYSMNDATILQIDVSGTNFAQLVLNCTTNDGAIIEDIYTISRGEVNGGGSYQINLYLSNDTDFLRPASQTGNAVTGGVYVGSIVASDQVGTWVHSTNMPYSMAPVPQVGSEEKFKAFYVPKGRTLWAARQTGNLTDNVSNAPLLGVQGGFF
ncbi:MAG: hypothetical protein CL681_06160 [Blastopirellula sp.]|nr:hypothetical protein [Blastopirellula sp.]